MKLSVIIPTCNRNDLLCKCLDLLAPANQTIVDDYEVIVTDDSRDDIAKNLINESYPWVKWVGGPKRGPAANRNNGAKMAGGEWLAFIDDDCLPDYHLLLGYQNGIKAHSKNVVFEGCTIVDRPKNKFNEEAPLNLTGGYLFSCNFAIRADYFRQLNGFDENFPYPAMEDSELAYRIRAQGVEMVFLKDAIIMHPWRIKQNSFNMTLKRFSSALYFIKKHPQERNKLGFAYYLRSFYHSVADTFKNSVPYNFRGITEKVIYDFMQLYFAFYMLFYKSRKRDLK
jgi:GT2 family glycosyltransferase